MPAPKPVRPGISEELAQKYQRVEAGFLVRDMLRRDGGGVDTPYAARDLARNFKAIALFQEYDARGRARPVAKRLTRWAGPVPLAVGFGAGISADRRVTDRNATLAFAGRLSRLTGLSFPPADEGAAALTVLFLTEADRRAAAPRLRGLLPGVAPGDLARLVDLDPDIYCAVIAMSGPDHLYQRAVVLIRDELPDLLRLSCIHEEMAQAMGLPNDSPRARPSIFNDDEEFALLTSQDEQMLRMLYDPALRPGMTAAEATPIVARLAARLTDT